MNKNFDTNNLIIGACGSDLQIPTELYNASYDNQFNIFMTFNSYYLSFKACNSNLCNNASLGLEFLNDNSTCENSLTIPKEKNIFPKSVVENAPSVTRCYSCNNCNTSTKGEIQYCNSSQYYNSKYVCQVKKI